MQKKLIIGVVVLILIFAIGISVYQIYIRQQQFPAKKLKIIEVPAEEAKKYIRLIYESKIGETASESLYNIDKLDGKLDKPHIVVKYPKIEEAFHMASKMEVAKELELIFIDKNDKILKKIKYVNTPYMGKMNVWFSKNRKIAIVFQMRRNGVYWYAYDREGNLLWKQEGTGPVEALYPHYISPDGEYIVITDTRPMEYPAPGEIMGSFPGDISREVGRQVVIVDKKLKLIRSHKIEGYERFGNAHFSPSGDYFAVVGYKLDETKNDLFLFTRKGKLVSEFRIGKLNVEGMSDEGYIFMERYRHEAWGTSVYSFKGRNIWHEDRGMALLNDGKNFYYQYYSSTPPGEIIIDAITRRKDVFIENAGEQFHLELDFPLVYSKGKPMLFTLSAKKIIQNGQSEINMGDCYLLIKDNIGLLIRLEDIFPEDVRGARLYSVEGEFWGDRDIGGFSKSSEEYPYSGRNCVEVILNE